VRDSLTEYAVPILPSRNLRETLEFYERLGFENRGMPPEEWDYMILGVAASSCTSSPLWTPIR
jgi:hypothetical protein